MTYVRSPFSCGVEPQLSLLRHWIGDPADRDRNSVTAITFSCAAIHFPTVYNLQHHQRPVLLITCLYGVGGYRSLESVKGQALAFLYPHVIHHITALPSRTSWHSQCITVLKIEFQPTEFKLKWLEIFHLDASNIHVRKTLKSSRCLSASLQ